MEFDSSVLSYTSPLPPSSAQRIYVGALDNQRRSRGRLSGIPFALWLLILPLAFDFKAEEGGGQATQWIILAVTLFGALLLAAKLKRPAYSSLPATLGRFAVSAPLLLGLIPLLAGYVEWLNYLRTGLPYFLLAVGFFIGARVVRGGHGHTLCSIVLVSASVSVIFTLVFRLSRTGWDVSTSRYEIMSSAMLPLQALLVHSIVIERSKSWIHYAMFSFAVAVQLLSVTRSALLATGMLLVTAIWMASPSLVAFLRNSGRRSLVGVLAVCVGTLIVGELAPELSDRWLQRLFGSYETFGVDITTITRIAEVDQQLELWAETPFTWAFGRGFGSEYTWHIDYFVLLSQVLSPQELALVHTVGGHNFWAYSLFSGGVVSGFWLPLAFLVSVVLLMGKVRRKADSDESYTLASRANLVLIAFLLSTIGGNPLSFRYAGLLYGMFLGVGATTFGTLSKPKHRRVLAP
jgi:hypothetical protein